MSNTVRDLSDISEGIKIRARLKDKSLYNKHCDILEKINYSIQDLNNESYIEFTNKEIIYIVVLTDWILECQKQLLEHYDKKIVERFHFTKDSEKNKCDKYIKALRSFVVAHPLSTNRHQLFAFDGDLICIDLRVPSVISKYFHEDQKMYINIDGCSRNIKQKTDFYLYAYSKKKDNMKNKIYIGGSIDDILYSANIYVDWLFEFSKYLKTIKTNKGGGYYE